MSFEVLQYIIALDFTLFAVLCAGIAPLMRKATADRMYLLISKSLPNPADGTKPSAESIRQAVENMSSPLSVFGDLRVTLFFMSVWAFAMFFSQALSSFVCKLMNPTTTEHLVYAATSVFGMFYVVVAGVFLMVENTWQALLTHVTLGGVASQKEEES